MERVGGAWKSIGYINGTALAALLQAHFSLERGEFDAAVRLFSEYQKDANEAAPQSDRITAIESDLWLGLVAWKQGRIGTAGEKLEHLRLLFSELPEDRRELAVQLERAYKILQAEVWLSEGRAGEAVSFMEKQFSLQVPILYPGSYPRAFAWYNFPQDQDVLARAFAKMGNLDRAIEEYKTLITFDPASQDRRLHNPVYYYRLARLYEQKGLRGEAKKEYARFLEMWKDADADIPELTNAKMRLAQL